MQHRRSISAFFPILASCLRREDSADLELVAPSAGAAGLSPQLWVPCAQEKDSRAHLCICTPVLDRWAVGVVWDL